MTEGRRASYSQSASFAVLSFASVALVGVGSSIAIARIYGVNIVGEYALAIGAVNVLRYISSAREQAALVRELSTLEPRAGRVTGLFAAVFAFSTALTVAVAILVTGGVYLAFEGPVDQPDLFIPALASIAGYVIFQNACWNIDQVLAGFRAGRELFWLRLHWAVVFTGTAVGLGIAWRDVWALVIATIAPAVTTLAHRMFILPRFVRYRVPREDLRAGMKTLPEMIRFGLKIAPGQIAGAISNQTGTWVLAVTSSIAAVGAYSRAWLLGSRFLELTWRVVEMLFPTLVERRAKGDHAGFDMALVDSVRYAFISMLVFAAAAGGAAHGLMDGLFGPGFGSASDALALILVMPALTSAAFIERNALFAVDRPTVGSVTAIGRMIVTIAATVALALLWGITGAALALVIGSVFEFVVVTWITRPHIETSIRALWPVRHIAALALAYGLGFLAARAVDEALPGLLGAGCGLVAGAGLYTGVLLASGALQARDRARLAGALAAIRTGRGRRPKSAIVGV
jgi:O-antigen/teichoic acid export membrane protein